jgi:hypothetical protein
MVNLLHVRIEIVMNGLIGRALYVALGIVIGVLLVINGVI